MPNLFYLMLLFTALANVSYGSGQIERDKLANGMEVYVIENHRAPIATHMVLYHVGAANEPQGQSGLAHFLEHLMFHGTNETKDISSVIQKNGGFFNASTSSYYTNYYETVPKSKLSLMMQLEADRMRNINIIQDAVVAEKKIVAEERRMRVDNLPSARLEEEMESAFYRNNKSWQVIGWLDEIAGYDKKKAENLYNKFYYPNNAVLVVVGDVTMAEVLLLAEKYYGPIAPSSHPIDHVILNEPEHNADISVTLSDSNVREQEVKVWYKAPNISYGSDSLSLFLASVIIGEARVSYLYKELVLNNVVNYVYSNYDPWTNGSAIFRVSATTSQDPIIVKDKIIEVINKVSGKGITMDELTKAKKILKANLAYISENPMGQASLYGTAVIFGGYDMIKSLNEEIEKITLEQINKVLKSVLYEKNTTVGYLKPKEVRDAV